MTVEELVQNGWIPRECKIDTLYFKSGFLGGYFIHLHDTIAEVFSNYDDMNPLGEAETLEEIKELQRLHEREIIENMTDNLILVKMEYQSIYHEKI